MIRGASAAKRDPPWQDLRAMHSRKAICSAFRIHGARILPMPARFGYTAAICCQEGALFPSEAPSGMHEARILPRMAARERTTREYCHGRRPMNAPRRNLAAAGRWGGQLAQRARKAASRSGSTRKADSLAGIRRGSSQGRFARWDSRSGSTHTASSLAGICRAAREARRTQRVREAAQRARPTGHKKSAAPKNGAFPAKLRAQTRSALNRNGLARNVGCHVARQEHGNGGDVGLRITETA